jgi:hypothetical protein
MYASLLPMPPPNSASAVGPLHRERLTLRLAYWHQHPEGESRKHHAELARLCGDYLRTLNSLKCEFPWDCHYVGLEPGIARPDQIVSVQVNKISHCFSLHVVSTALYKSVVLTKAFPIGRFCPSGLYPRPDYRGPLRMPATVGPTASARRA